MLQREAVRVVRSAPAATYDRFFRVYNSLKELNTVIEEGSFMGAPILNLFPLGTIFLFEDRFEIPRWWNGIEAVQIGTNVVQHFPTKSDLQYYIDGNEDWNRAALNGEMFYVEDENRFYFLKNGELISFVEGTAATPQPAEVDTEALDEIRGIAEAAVEGVNKLVATTKQIKLVAREARVAAKEAKLIAEEALRKAKKSKQASPPIPILRIISGAISIINLILSIRANLRLAKVERKTDLALKQINTLEKNFALFMTAVTKNLAALSNRIEQTQKDVRVDKLIDYLENWASCGNLNMCDIREYVET